MNTINKFINKKLFFLLFLSFILATIIGTITHELAHFFVARYLGYASKLSFAETFVISAEQNDSILITISGPLLTMLTGTLGVITLYIYRRDYYRSVKLSFRHWLIIFTALFWLRQTANLFLCCVTYLMKGKLNAQSDEIRIANYFNLPVWSIISFTGITGIFILSVVILKFVPNTQRSEFLVSGCLGGATGYYIWIICLGTI